ncbi:hypothetical protein BO85DRAFT_454253 [Aspergillus piperis CBS 112811]|uniref:Uncharacterized protein n=1 Tax=Aspergillus piperis CBS 112811 TaxID=1448313 RepID=A0A8G1QSU6_9EURO|nr:hypothetical protein BO85DRAFT_454253 [Aspergillus piperis CBS 112811]RAH52197.1 hypothetical protein BO85DRAFT_454253 [Aspergillus piperis CBS 112811]
MVSSKFLELAPCVPVWLSSWFQDRVGRPWLCYSVAQGNQSFQRFTIGVFRSK